MKKPYFPMFVDLSGRQVTVVGGVQHVSGIGRIDGG